MVLNFEKRQKISHFACLNVGIKRLKRRKNKSEWFIQHVKNKRSIIAFKNRYLTHSSFPWIILCLGSLCLCLCLGFVGDTVSKAPGRGESWSPEKGCRAMYPERASLGSLWLGGILAEQSKYTGQTIKLPDFEQEWDKMSWAFVIHRTQFHLISETLGNVWAQFPGLSLVSQMMNSYIPVKSKMI